MGERLGKESYNPVPLRRGQMELTLICWGPYSAARPFVACIFLVNWVKFEGEDE